MISVLHHAVTVPLTMLARGISSSIRRAAASGLKGAGSALKCQAHQQAHGEPQPKLRRDPTPPINRGSHFCGPTSLDSRDILRELRGLQELRREEDLLVLKRTPIAQLLLVAKETLEISRIRSRDSVEDLVNLSLKAHTSFITEGGRLWEGDGMSLALIDGGLDPCLADVLGERLCDVFRGVAREQYRAVNLEGFRLS